MWEGEHSAAWSSPSRVCKEAWASDMCREVAARWAREGLRNEGQEPPATTGTWDQPREAMEAPKGSTLR